MNAFGDGPFTFTPGDQLADGRQQWNMYYGSKFIVMHTLEALTRDQVAHAFDDDRAAFVQAARDAHEPERVSLIDNETGNEVGYFFSFDMCGMTPGIVDDRSRYWLRSADRLYSRNVTLSEFAQIAASESVPPDAWIAGLLPGDVLTTDVEEWRAPTSFEIRHIVGESSFTHISGAKTAALAGVTPQNFRKYTARDDAHTRQKISYAMWHLLLHKLGVQRA